MRRPPFAKAFAAMIYGLVALSRPVWAGDTLKREPRVPAGLAFVRTIDLEAFAERQNDRGLGAQAALVRARYLDPDVNAFVGLLTGILHFNEDMRIGSPLSPSTAGTMWTFGGDFGIRRGAHLWELDLMGALLSDRLAFAPAIEGEHGLGGRWGLYHRTQASFFVGDTILDSDQGLYWRRGVFGVKVGYRIFAAQHMSRSGPRVGVTFLFENPKIPFLFPSLG